MLDLTFDRQFDGCGPVCGTDEAGRGPLAGPVVAAAVILPPGTVIEGLDDSKKLTEKKRELLFDVIKEKALAWGIAEASREEIDRMNILNASLTAMKRAVSKASETLMPGMVLVDGNRNTDFGVPSQTVVKGDSRSQSIAAASVLAKVYRDRLMEKLDAEYPVYGFAKHKGYPTKEHMLAVYEHGPSPAHRRSFLGFLERDSEALGAELEKRKGSGKSGKGSEMRYVSTRDNSERPASVLSAEAIKKGLAPDGGLYIPERFPALTAGDLARLGGMTYPERASRVLSMFLDDYREEWLGNACREAYSPERFPGGAAPLRACGDGIHLIELWHGPTSAFKDIALQIMPRLLSEALRMTGEKNTAHILVATSGDTGKAALEGYRDVPGVRITVFYPVDGVSDMQKRQMQTTEGSNVNVVAVRGNFDDTQNGVKAIFSDRDLSEKALAKGFFFGSANSINWGRLAPQIVYYISAYCDLVSSGSIASGDRINVCVPTGNFGNIFAAYTAMRMGLPVNRLIVASNNNNVLTDFIRTGTYDRTRAFMKTISPSMDILISSNLERLLYTLAGPATTSELMKALSEKGMYTAPSGMMETLRSSFYGYFMTEEETERTIASVFEKEGYLIDPHTAVGYGCVLKYREETGDGLPVVLASTASPYKFAPAVLRALGRDMPASLDGGDVMKTLSDIAGTEIPAPLASALSKPVRFTEVIDPAKMPSAAMRA